jgi:hypothetical protein
MKYLKKFECFESINEEKNFLPSFLTAAGITLATLGFGQKIDKTEAENIKKMAEENLRLNKLSIKFVDLQEKNPEITLEEAIKKLRTNKEDFIKMIKMMNHLKRGDDVLDLDDESILKDIEK